MAALGAGILVAIVGFLVFEAHSRPDAAFPDLAVRGGDVALTASGSYRVPVIVENVGHMTGAGVSVRGTLRDGDGDIVEESAITFDFVAQHSAASGGMFFTLNPADYRLELRAEGYTDPWPSPPDSGENAD